MTRSQDILLVFLAQPAYYLFFSALSASSAVNKKRSGKRINNSKYRHLTSKYAKTTSRLRMVCGYFVWRCTVEIIRLQIDIK
jgi:hypothetical protein